MSFELQNLVLIVALLAASVWTVVTSDLLRSAIGLAITSAILTLQIFLYGGPLAAVFELSVCAGLVTVVFVSTIALTKPRTPEAQQEQRQSRLRRFAFLPMLLVLVFLYLQQQGLHPGHVAPAPQGAPLDVRQALWAARRFDLIGQILVVLSGIFGVVVLFKTRDCGEEGKS